MGDANDDYVASLAHAVGDEPALSHLDRSDLPTFASEYRRRRAETRPVQRAAAVGLAAVVSGPFAILGALTGPGGLLAFFLLVVLVAPVVEELLKIAGALYLTEVRPWLVPSATSLVVIAVLSGLAFAAIENAFYLLLYIDDPSPEIVRWRWVFGPLIHGTGSLLAGIGVARMWRDIHRGAIRARFTVALPWVVAGMLVHGVYNLTVTLWEVLGGGI